VGNDHATRASPVAIPPDCPEQLLDALRARGAGIERFRLNSPRVRLWASSPSEKLFAWYSTDPADRAVVEHEVAVRAAIGTEGPLRAPPVLAYGPLWRLEPALEGRGELAGEGIDSVIAAIAVLQERDLPQPPPQLTRSREAPIARWRRRLLMLRSPLPARDLMRARRLFTRSPLPLTTSHGDLHRKQIFPAPGGVWVVDWELLGKRPAGWDAVFLSWDLQDPEDRDRLFLATLELVGRRYRSGLLALKYAALVRMIVGKLVGSRRVEDREQGLMLLEELPRVREEARIS
jgi:phosphotransferase family enzyme